MELMNQVIEKYDLRGAIVVDMGSYDVNGTYRPLFSGGKYIGADIIPGPNVDVIVDSEEWQKIENVDAVISGQTIEHVADIPAFMRAINQILKPGGILCIIAPSEGPVHDYPIWVGNFSRERLCQVVRDGGFEILSCTMSEVLPWKLTTCVARKPDSILKEQKKYMKITNLSLAIGIPCSFPFVPVSFLYSFLHMERPDFTLIHADNGPPDTLRNDIVEKAFSIGATKLIMMDTDMIYHPKTITSLLARRLPVVAALCFRRYPPFDSIMLRVNGKGYESVDEWEEGELVEVDATGAGCMMFDMNVFKKMPYPWFKFQKNIDTGAIIGEDIGFCQDLKAAGYKIFVDTSVPADHLTTMAINRKTNLLYRSMKAAEWKKRMAMGVIEKIEKQNSAIGG